MKNTIKKIVSMLLTIGICSSFAFTVQADSEYDHIGFDYMQSAYSKGATEYLEVTAYDADNEEVTFEEDLTYSSSNENVVTVDENGLMTMVDYGVATVTATSGNLSASMLVTVKNSSIDIAEAGEGPGMHSTDMVRTGSYSYKVPGGTNPVGVMDYAYEYAKKNLIYNNANIPANAVMDAWFYDNGSTTDSIAAVYMSAYKIDTNGTKAVGIINSSDTTYKLTGKGARRARSNSTTWKEGSQVGICSDVTNTLIDTGIARTKGWHQVTFIRKNTDASANINDNGSKRKSTSYYTYIDGQLVDTETGTDRSFVMFFGYAGYDSNHSAYIADAKIHQYIGVEDIDLIEVNGTFTINHKYYGTTGDQTNSYKWQVSDNGETDWTDIAGATSQTYAPSADFSNKYIRGAVKVATASAQTGYNFSEAENIFIFDGTYDSISLGKNISSLSKGDTNSLNLTGYRYGHELSILDLSDVAFTSSNESVATVTDAGVVTAVDYGVVTITATYGNLTASMLITVTNSSTAIAEAGEGPGMHSTDMVRTGSYSYKVPGGTNAVGVMDYAYEYAKKNLIYVNTIPANAVMEAWFYDNGSNSDAEAAIYMSAYKIDTNGTRAVGIINSSDTTYKLTGKGARRARSNSTTWKDGSQVGICSDVTNTLIDTGIARTKGWHQVTFIRKNTDASAKIEDNGKRPKSTSYYTYLDGQLVDTETGTDRSFVMLFGYAGYNSNHNAYIADATIRQYICLEDVDLSELNGTFSINPKYYGTTDSQTPEYKWQISDDGETDWTDIDGATSQTYTPSAEFSNKYIRGAVKVATTNVQTEYILSKAENIFIFDGTYDSISLGKNTSSLSKGETNSLNLTGYRYGHELSILDLSDVEFTSSDESVATVTDAGVVTAVDYGVATITATYHGKTATMLITVTNSSTAIAEAGEGPGAHSTDMVRTGSYSYKFPGGTNAVGVMDYTYEYAKKNLIYVNTIPANAVMEVWFYDNGQLEDSEAAVYMSAYKIDTSGTRAVGIINSSDTTYKVTGKGARRALSSANNWKEGSQVGICSEVTNTLIDTGIERTKGWHQVTFIRKNTDASATIADNGTRPKSTSYYTYLDGQLVDTETGKDRSFVMLFGYAGYNSNHNAYFADATIHQYIGVEDILLTESNGSFTVNSDYYGTKETQTISYKWQVSDNGVTGWTDIAGATSQTYTPASNIKGKFLRAAVSVVAGDTSVDLRSSDAYYVEASLQYNNGTVYITSASDIEDAVLIIAEYKTVGSFIKLVSSSIVSDVDVIANVQKTVSFGNIAPASGNKVKIMLWEDMNTQKSLCGITTIE